MTVSLTLILADVINDHTTQHAHQQLTHNGPFRDPRRVCIHRRPRGARRRCQAADNLRDCPRQQGTVQKMPRFAATCADLRLTHAARRAMLSCSPGPRSLRRTTLGRARFHIVSGQRSQTTDRATGLKGGFPIHRRSAPLTRAAAGLAHTRSGSDSHSPSARWRP